MSWGKGGVGASREPSTASWPSWYEASFAEGSAVVMIQSYSERKVFMMKYWIFDKDETPQRFPLQRLIRRIREVVGFGADTFKIRKVRGYGLQIGEWDDALDTIETIDVPFDLLDRLSKGTEEWFYDLEAHTMDTNVRFGLHDSTALFVDASPEVAAKIVAMFADARPAECG